jgi:hypothetical protein
MDAVFRSRRLLLIALGAAVCHELGCAVAGPRDPVGASRSTVDDHRDSGTVDAGTPSSPIPSDFRTALAKKNHARFLSRGHGVGHWDAEVYASRDAEEAWAHDRGTVAVGARFVAEHFERGTAVAGPLYMMEKREAGYDTTHGDWRYVVVSTRSADKPAVVSTVVKDGPLEACATCHADAPHDHVFRVDD